MDIKREKGQFYTVCNPFNEDLFYKWFKLAWNASENHTVLEPFAGANNIINLVADLEIKNDIKWDCFDIDPNIENKAPDFPIVQKDTIADFPSGYDIVVTNPPYLAKNSATRRHLDYPDTEYDDLYKLCLSIMLENVDYVAAIIPESFITSELFQDRLYGVISVGQKIFDDTECPVCVALFVSASEKAGLDLDQNDYFVVKDHHLVGKYLTIKPSQDCDIFIDWAFNDPNGNIGIHCIDSPKAKTIEFVRGETIDSSKIKVSSRSYTRVSGLPDDIEVQEFLDKSNTILQEYRDETKDVFLTSFKGLREDGDYRRRLDFKNAKWIMNRSVAECKKGHATMATSKQLVSEKNAL